MPNVGRECTTHHICSCQQERMAMMKATLELVEAHLEELREAWERGVISESDCKGGLRSNRNFDALLAVRKALGRVAGK